MKKKKILRLLILMGVIVGLLIAAPIVDKGYDMYKGAIGQMSIEERIGQLRSDDNYVEIEKISQDFLEMVVESEDKRFYDHNGINLISTTRAMFSNLRAGTTVEGGSSITQQLAKNMYFSFEKRYERKVAELFVAFDLEKNVTKDEILEMYSNIAYFGEGCYGLREASNHYYNVEPSELNIEQSAALVLTLKSPSNFNPNSNPNPDYNSNPL